MYEVSWCVIGKEPDCEPYSFNKWADAIKFLHDEVWWLTRDFYSNGQLKEQDEANDCMNKLSEIRDQEPKNYVGAIAGISYWISFVDPLEGLWKL